MTLKAREVEGLYTMAQLAEALGWTYRQVYYRVREDQMLAPSKVVGKGRRPYYTQAEFEGLLSKFKEQV